MGGKCCRCGARKVGPVEEPFALTTEANEGERPRAEDSAPEVRHVPIPTLAGGLKGFLDDTSPASTGDRSKELDALPRCPQCAPGHGGELKLNGEQDAENVFGWYCVNYRNCGEAESVCGGRWRWSCQTCRKDYCGKCYKCLQDGGHKALERKDNSRRDDLDKIHVDTLDLIQMRQEIHHVPLPPTDWHGEVLEPPSPTPATQFLSPASWMELSPSTSPVHASNLPISFSASLETSRNLPSFWPVPLAAPLQDPDVELHIADRQEEGGEPEPLTAAPSAATAETEAFLTKLIQRPKMPEPSDETQILDRMIVEHRLHIEHRDIPVPSAPRRLLEKPVPEYCPEPQSPQSGNPDMFVVGESCEGKAASGTWWPVCITARNSDGTYAVDVHDSEGSKWPVVFPENLRRPPSCQSVVRDETAAEVRDHQSESLTAHLELIAKYAASQPGINELRNQLENISSELAAERQQSAELAAANKLHASELAAERRQSAELAAANNQHAAELERLRGTAEQIELFRLRDTHAAEIAEQSEAELHSELRDTRTRFVGELIEAQTRVDETVAALCRAQDQAQRSRAELIDAQTRIDDTAAGLRRAEDQAQRSRGELSDAQMRAEDQAQRSRAELIDAETRSDESAASLRRVEDQAHQARRDLRRYQSLEVSQAQQVDHERRLARRMLQRYQALEHAQAKQADHERHLLQVLCFRSWALACAAREACPEDGGGVQNLESCAAVEVADKPGCTDADEAKMHQGSEPGLPLDECDDSTSLEVFVTYTTGLPSSSKMSMKLGCGRRKDAPIAIMQIHPLRFELGSCLELGSRAFVNGGASLNVRTWNLVGEAKLVLHPTRARYCIYLHAPEVANEHVAGFSSELGNSWEEIQTHQRRPILVMHVRRSADATTNLPSGAGNNHHPYLRSHALEHYMANLLWAMAHEKVEDPTSFLQEQLRALTHRPPATALPDAGTDNDDAARVPEGTWEVSLEGSEGIPEDAVINFSGPVQGKAPFSQLLQGRTLRLVAHKESREPLKLMVTQAEHDTSVSLDPAQLHYHVNLQAKAAAEAEGEAVEEGVAKRKKKKKQGSELEVNPGGPQHEMGLHVRLANCRRLLTADSFPITSQADKLQKQQGKRPKHSSREYIKSHGLVALTQELLRYLVLEQPADPYSFLLERLDALSCDQPVEKKRTISRSSSGTGEETLDMDLERQLCELRAMIAKVCDDEAPLHATSSHTHGEAPLHGA